MRNQPSVVNASAVASGRCPVAAEDVRAPDLDLAGGLGQAHLDPGKREADGARPALAVVGVGHEHVGLGHAVALEHRHAGVGLQRLGGARRAGRPSPTRRAAAGPSSAARDEAARRWYMVGTPKNSVASCSAAASSTPSTVEPREQDGRCAGQQRPVQAVAEAVGVEQREGEDEAVLGRPPPGPLQRLAVGQQVAVGQRGALGRPGRARRVAEVGEVVGSDGVERRRGSVGQVDLGADDHDVGTPGGAAPIGPGRRRRPRRPGRPRRGRRGPPPARCRRCWSAPRRDPAR